MSDDKSLKQAVLDELKWEPSINAAHIGVIAENGVVTLTGTVDAYFQKRAAEEATLRVKDVKAVAEEIEVKLPMTVKHDDATIARAAIDSLAWNASIPRDAVKVTVSKGWVTLSGQVHWHYQHDAAANAVRSLWGVTGVTNQISIKPKVNLGNIKSDITAALDRSWFSPEKIEVTANDGAVTLKGKVEYWAERALAGATAWAAPGVTSVTNNIMVA